MKFRYMSDLHLDADARVHRHSKGIRDADPALFMPPPMADDKDTVLLLAGDVWEGVKPLCWDGYSWMSKVAAQFKAVAVVFGNHDYWSGNVSTAVARYRAELEFQGLGNVHLLENGAVTFDDGDVKVRVLGATLWTDCDRDPLLMFDANNSWSDYRRTRIGPNYRRFRAEDSALAHKASVEFLERELADDVMTVVLTHMAPSSMSVAPQYRGDRYNALYYSDLDRLMIRDTPAVWVHGHMHSNFDYEIYSTRVLCNPRGYLNPTTLNVENAAFNPHAWFEL